MSGSDRSPEFLKMGTTEAVLQLEGKEDSAKHLLNNLEKNSGEFSWAVMFLGINILLKLGSKIDDYKKDRPFRLSQKRYAKRRKFPTFRKAIYEKTELSVFSKSDIRKDGTFRLFEKRYTISDYEKTELSVFSKNDIRKDGNFRLFEKRYTKRRNFPSFRKAIYEKTELSDFSKSWLRKKQLFNSIWSFELMLLIFLTILIPLLLRMLLNLDYCFFLLAKWRHQCLCFTQYFIWYFLYWFALPKAWTTPRAVKATISIWYSNPSLNP